MIGATNEIDMNSDGRIDEMNYWYMNDTLSMLGFDTNGDRIIDEHNINYYDNQNMADIRKFYINGNLDEVQFVFDKSNSYTRGGKRTTSISTDRIISKKDYDNNEIKDAQTIIFWEGNRIISTKFVPDIGGETPEEIRRRYIPSER